MFFVYRWKFCDFLSFTEDFFNLFFPTMFDSLPEKAEGNYQSNESELERERADGRVGGEGGDASEARYSILPAL